MEDRNFDKIQAGSPYLNTQRRTKAEYDELVRPFMELVVDNPKYSPECQAAAKKYLKD